MADRQEWYTVHQLQPRPSVMMFARIMEMVLRRHDATKGGQANWQKDALSSLARRVAEEAKELADVVELSRKANSVKDYRDRIAEEAADVANMAMMVADSALRWVNDPK